MAPAQPADTAALQALIDTFVGEYHHRPAHRSLPQRRTPATPTKPAPKPSPAGNPAAIRTIDAATGELLRKLVLDPAKRHEPTGRPPGPTPKRTTPQPTAVVQGFPMS